MANVPFPFPNKTPILLPVYSAIATSSLPSLLKSPTATPSGPFPPAAIEVAVLKVPSPLPINKDTFADA